MKKRLFSTFLAIAMRDFNTCNSIKLLKTAEMRYFLSNPSLLKVTARNIKRFGKHSELLKITDDPLAYVKEEIQKMNEEYRVGRLPLTATLSCVSLLFRDLM